MSMILKKIDNIPFCILDFHQHVDSTYNFITSDKVDNMVSPKTKIKKTKVIFLNSNKKIKFCHTIHTYRLFIVEL